VDAGQVLTFDLGGGRHDIAGSPVNIASKLAQDVGEFGRIYVTDGAAAQAGLAASARRMKFEVSGVQLGAVVL
jgi:class 3 adenylate cyclase